MRVDDLPRVGVISNPIHDFYGEYSDLSGKDVLCIGFSEAEACSYVEKYGPARITLLTNWVGHKDADVSRFPLVIGDITKRTQFDDDAFDAILTLSVLEHLGDLSGAFAEMTRLVKPRGEMLHMFGPAWSCAYGHHLYANADDPLLNFSRWDMPAHMHLLCSRDEIRAFYGERGYPVSTADTVVQWLYDSPIINRVPYDDYRRLMEGDRFQIDRMHLMYNDLPKEHLAALRAAWPRVDDFATYGGRYRLIVRK